jgi:hypothetical protein
MNSSLWRFRLESSIENFEVKINIPLLFMIFIGALGLTSCDKRLETRQVRIGDCITGFNHGDADIMMVIRSDSSYLAFQESLSQKYSRNGSHECTFPDIDFSRQLLVGALVKILGHQGASCDESAWYSSSDGVLEIYLSTDVEESGNSEIHVLNYFTVDDVPDMDCKVRVYVDGEEIVEQTQVP